MNPTTSVSTRGCKLKIHKLRLGKVNLYTRLLKFGATYQSHQQMIFERQLLGSWNDIQLQGRTPESTAAALLLINQQKEGTKAGHLDTSPVSSYIPVTGCVPVLLYRVSVNISLRFTHHKQPTWLMTS